MTIHFFPQKEMEVFLYLMLHRSVSEDELEEIIGRRSRDMLTEEIVKTKAHLETTPFIVRKEKVLYENIPQLLFINEMINKSKRDSQYYAQKLLQFKSQLIDALPSGMKLDEALEKPEFKRLYIRVQLHKQLMDSYERSFGLMMEEKDALQIERDKIRIAAIQDSKRVTPPPLFLQAYPIPEPLFINEAKKNQLEAEFEQTNRLSKTIEQRWRILVEGIEEKSEQAPNAEGVPPSGENQTDTNASAAPPA